MSVYLFFFLMSVFLSFFLFICISVRLSVYTYICLSTCPFVCLSVRLSVCLSDRLSVPLSVRLSIFLYMSVYLSVCLSVSNYLFDRWMYRAPFLFIGQWEVLGFFDYRDKTGSCHHGILQLKRIIHFYLEHLSLIRFYAQ